MIKGAVLTINASMKNITIIFCISLVIISCKMMRSSTHPDRNGFEVVYVGYDPKDSLYEGYPVKDTDSLEFHYDPVAKKTRIYIVEVTRYIVLNENFELLWIESR